MKLSMQKFDTGIITGMEQRRPCNQAFRHLNVPFFQQKLQ